MLSQHQSSDNRDCGYRKAVFIGRMADSPSLSPEATDIFRRLEAIGATQKQLADALELEPNKISKAKIGERQFKAAEVLKARDWLAGLERAGKQPDQPTVSTVDAGETVGIIQLDLSLSMGPGTLIEDFVESEVVAMDASLLRRITRTPSDRLRLVTGIGTSHEPKFQSNDQFLIDINDRKLTRIDGYYWITFDGAHALKRLRPLGGGRVQVISENPEFTPMELEANEVRIEGRAIWFARGL